MDQQRPVQNQGQHNQQNQLQQNQSLAGNDALAILMSKVQSIEGSMRRQTGDIAQIKGSLSNSQSNVENAETSNDQITRQEFNKAINYLYNEMVKQSSNTQQVLTNEIKQVKQQLEFAFSNPNSGAVIANKAPNTKTNSTQNMVQNKVMGLSGGQTSVKLSLPLIGDIHLPLPIPAKFIKPVAVGGLVLFALVLIFFGAR